MYRDRATVSGHRRAHRIPGVTLLEVNDAPMCPEKTDTQKKTLTMVDNVSPASPRARRDLLRPTRRGGKEDAFLPFESSGENGESRITQATVSQTWAEDVLSACSCTYRFRPEWRARMNRRSPLRLQINGKVPVDQFHPFLHARETESVSAHGLLDIKANA